MTPSVHRTLSLCSWVGILALPWVMQQGEAYSSLLPNTKLFQPKTTSSSISGETAQLSTAAAPPRQSLISRRRRRQTRIRRVTQLAMSSQVYDSSTAVAAPLSPGSSYPDDVNDLTLRQVPRPALSPLEVWWLVRIEQWYEVALAHKCPFLRRRSTDFMDTLELLVRQGLVRPKNLPLIGVPNGLRGDERTHQKTKHLSLDEVAAVLRRDWKEDSRKGYYVTGRLTPAIYRDDCFFDGPDPDMPVRGLRKFLNAASQLFDAKQSKCELLDLTVQEQLGVIVARWKMNGVISLPWRPIMPEVVGETIYSLDHEGLIHSHEETWDISAAQAFLKTTWFDFARMEAH